MKVQRKAWLVLAGVLAMTAIGASQVKEIIKIVGVGAAVKHFGPQINSAINKLAATIKRLPAPRCMCHVAPGRKLPSTTVEFTDMRAISLGSVLDRSERASEGSECF